MNSIYVISNLVTSLQEQDAIPPFFCHSSCTISGKIITRILFVQDSITVLLSIVKLILVICVNVALIYLIIFDF